MYKRPMTIQTMTITQHERNEWARLAQAAYNAGRNDVGHRFSVAASRPSAWRPTLAEFDRLQSEYRAWLVFNEWPTREIN